MSGLRTPALAERGLADTQPLTMGEIIWVRARGWYRRGRVVQVHRGKAAISYVIKKTGRIDTVKVRTEPDRDRLFPSWRRSQPPMEECQLAPAPGEEVAA